MKFYIIRNICCHWRFNVISAELPATGDDDGRGVKVGEGWGVTLNKHNGSYTDFAQLYKKQQIAHSCSCYLDIILHITAGTGTTRREACNRNTFTSLTSYHRFNFKFQSQCTLKVSVGVNQQSFSRRTAYKVRQCKHEKRCCIKNKF